MIVAIVLAVLPGLSLSSAQAQGDVEVEVENVVFNAPPIEPSRFRIEQARYRGEVSPQRRQGQELRGWLFRPPGQDGSARLPALVLLHSCRGATRAEHAWAKSFVSWGYVVLLIDSYGPRNRDATCAGYDDMESIDQTFDAIGGLQFLHRRGDVDVTRIGLVGWSVGASKVLLALNDIGIHNLYDEKFSAGVAFYPYCLAASGPFMAPLLMLVGERDDWTPARRCQSLVRANADSGHSLELEILPDAAHFFDHPGIGPPRLRTAIENREKSPTRGALWGYDAKSHEKAMALVRAYLRRQFGAP